MAQGAWSGRNDAVLNKKKTFPFFRIYSEKYLVKSIQNQISSLFFIHPTNKTMGVILFNNVHFIEAPSLLPYCYTDCCIIFAEQSELN